MSYTELLYIDGWLAANKLKINKSKTFYMMFHRARTKSNIAVVMNKEIIKQAKTLKFIGIISDENLKWNRHIKHVSSKQLNNAIVYMHLNYNCISILEGLIALYILLRLVEVYKCQ